MIQIYGSPRGSAGRCYLMLEEAGVPYEVIPVDMANKEHKSEAYLKLNPNGKVPCLKENEFVLWESAAIVHYLAEKHKPELMGRSLTEKALVQQWSFWTMTEAQPPLVDILIQKVFVPEGKKDLGLIERREQQVPGVFAVLDKSLTGKKFLVGDQYSVADLMVGSATILAEGLRIDLSNFSNIKTWMAEITSRPAWKTFLQLSAKK